MQFCGRIAGRRQATTIESDWLVTLPSEVGGQLDGGEQGVDDGEPYLTDKRYGYAPAPP